MSGPLLGAGTGACLLSGIGKPRFFVFFLCVVVVGGLPRRRASRPAVWSLVLLLGESTLLIRQPCAGMVGADPSPLVAVVGRLLASLDTRPVIGDGQLFAQVFSPAFGGRWFFLGNALRAMGAVRLASVHFLFVFFCVFFSLLFLFSLTHSLAMEVDFGEPRKCDSCTLCTTCTRYTMAGFGFCCQTRASLTQGQHVFHVDLLWRIIRVAGSSNMARPLDRGVELVRGGVCLFVRVCICATAYDVFWLVLLECCGWWLWFCVVLCLRLGSVT